MAITITNMHNATFETNVRLLAQQTIARLRPYVREKKQSTAANSWGRVAASDMVAKSSARTSTPEVDTVWSNRIAVPATKHIGDTTEPEDAVQMAIEPGSAIVQTFAAAANRQVDDIIIAAASGTALDEADANNVFPAGQKVGGATTEFTFSLVTSIVELFLTNDIGAEIRKVAVISPNCVRKMLGWDQVVNSQYNANNAQVLSAGGVVRNWLGFDWVPSTRLAVPGTGQRKLLFFSQQALGLLVAKDIWTEMAKDPSKSFLTRFYAALTMGCVRVEDEHIVEATVLES